MANLTNYTPSSLIGSQAAEVKLIFCSLNDPKPKTDNYHPGEYGVNVLIPKNSSALKEIVVAYKGAIAHARNSGIEIPDVKSERFFLKDGDKFNQKRVSNGKEPIEAFKGCYYFVINSKYQPIMYNDKAQYAFATDNAGRQIIVNNHPQYYLSNLEGSIVQICMKWNVGVGINGTYAKPYLDWVMQVKAGASAGPSIAPTIPTWGREVNKDKASAPIAPNTPIDDSASDYDGFNTDFSDEFFN